MNSAAPMSRCITSISIASRPNASFETLGLDELFAEPGNLVLLEWGEKFPRFQRERDIEISIERRGEQERRVVVQQQRNL